MWFLYEQVFEVTDIYAIISERNRKINADRLALEAHLAGRSMKEPKNPQNTGKLILRHFSKRYSTSDVYAVYDANLEIEGGQIFGFLGPNGAGKSTIIKSIVGIQTISGGEIETQGDHRIAMAAAVGATHAAEAVMIDDAACAAKSYPSFFADFERLERMRPESDSI